MIISYIIFFKECLKEKEFNNKMIYSNNFICTDIVYKCSLLILSQSKTGVFYSILGNNFDSYSITCIYISFSCRSENIFQDCYSLFLSQGCRSDSFLILVANLEDRKIVMSIM